MLDLDVWIEICWSSIESKESKILEEEKVEYRLGTAGGGNQALQPYLKKFNYRINDKMHIVDYIHSNSLYIGNHPELTEEQIINLCKKLNNV